MCDVGVGMDVGWAQVWHFYMFLRLMCFMSVPLLILSCLHGLIYPVNRFNGFDMFLIFIY